MNKSKLLMVSLTVLTALFSFSCKDDSKTNKTTFNGMGTVLSVIYTGEKKPEIEKRLKEDVEWIENSLSYYKEESDVSKLNKTGHLSPVEVHPEVCRLIEISLDFLEKTDGAFDIAYKSRGLLWDKGKEPDEKELQKSGDLTGKGLIDADCKKNEVSFRKAGVKIDLGGIAKGYSIDRAGSILKNAGVTDFIVNYGGDMLVCGKKGTNPWTVGIRNPGDKEQTLKTLIFSETGCQGIATSGDYERFFVINGKKYSHVFDPRTGRPSENASSVTIVADNAVKADAIATAVSVLINEEQKIKKIMEKFNVKIYTSSGPEMKWIEW
jgi:FAD:protein FMN transferase